MHWLASLDRKGPRQSHRQPQWCRTGTFGLQNDLLGGGLKHYLCFTPILGDMIQFD